MSKSKRKGKKGMQESGAALAADHVPPTPEFAAKHALEKVKTDQKSVTLRVQDKRPIDKYHRLYCIDLDRGIGERHRRGITEDQFRAADRIACNYERSFPKVVMPLNSMRVQSSVNVSMYPVESVMNAIHVHTRVMRELSKISQDIIEAVCCKEACLIEYEQGKGWRKGYGMIRLREALDELVEAFRTAFKNRSSS